jgi:uncharacterized protein YbjT (DUF2867 family)|tara:strand:+ start:632 stop:1579 length:948 start_codon:yes stop_codon:yes gene_type:complete
MSLLIIGGTGTLGRQIVKQALNEGYQVRCLARNLRRATFLKDWGAELVYGDLSLPETIPPALKGISLVIDAATIRPTDNYNSELIDWKGKIALIEAAKLANVKKFTFFSVLGASSNDTIPLIDLKLKVSKLLSQSGMSCTIFNCSGFFQGIINQYAIPVLENKTVWLLGKSNPIAYLDTQDAAVAVIKNLLDLEPGTKTLALIGKKFWTSEEVVGLCERLSGKEAKILYVPNILLGGLRRFFRFFEFTWNISDRLQFSELSIDSNKFNSSVSEVDWTTERLSLEAYLQEYFGKIMKKLKETNYQQSKQSNEISFL